MCFDELESFVDVYIALTYYFYVSYYVAQCCKKTHYKEVEKPCLALHFRSPIFSEKCKTRVWSSNFGGLFSALTRGSIWEEQDSFLSLVLVLFQNLLSGFKVLFARQGSLLGFALSDASDLIRCNFNRDNLHNLHGTVQQNLHWKRKLHFGRKQPVVRCQRNECIDD